MAKEHYGTRTPEFALMSKRPGIGKPWLDKFLSDIYPKDYFTINGKKYKPPRYYDTILEKQKPEMYKEIKKRRKEAIKEEDGLRLFQLNNHRKLITKTLQRNLENE